MKYNQAYTSMISSSFSSQNIAGTLVLSRELACLAYLKTWGGKFANAVNCYQELQLIYKENLAFFDSIGNVRLHSDFKYRHASQKAGIDPDLGITILRCIYNRGWKSIAKILNVDEKSVPSSYGRGFAKLSYVKKLGKEEKLEVSRILPELFEVEKTLRWVSELQSWFANPSFRAPPKGQVNLSAEIATQIIPWLNGMKWSLETLIREATKNHPLSEGRQSTTIHFSVELDRQGCVLMSLALKAPSIALPKETQELKLASYLIGGAITRSNRLNLVKAEDLYKARSLSSRPDAIKALQEKLPNISTNCLRQEILFLLAAGVVNINLLAEPRPIKLIRKKENKDPKKPVSIAVAMVEAVQTQSKNKAEAKLVKSVLVISKNLIKDPSFSSCRINLGHKAIKHYVKSGTFLGSSLSLLVQQKEEGAPKKRIGAATAISWEKDRAPVFRFSPNQIVSKFENTRWLRWAANWANRGTKNQPDSIIHSSLIDIDGHAGLYATGKRIYFTKAKIGDAFALFPLQIPAGQSHSTERLLLVLGKPNGNLIGILRGKKLGGKYILTKCCSKIDKEIFTKVKTILPKLLEETSIWSIKQN